MKGMGIEARNADAGLARVWKGAGVARRVLFENA